MVDLIVGLVAGVLLGAVVGFFVASSRAARRAASERQAALAAAKEEAGVRERLVAELSRNEALLEQERNSARLREEAIEDLRSQAAGQFAELSAAALRHNSEQFLVLADRRMREAQQSATAELDQRRAGIEQLFVPLREQLQRYEEGMRSLERERQTAYAALSERVLQLTSSQEKLQAETRNLVTALRAPATRGRWGELQLRRVVEIAGMLEHCDFEEQVTTKTDEGRLRPDVVIHLPGHKRIVVDAKVPLEAFLDANDATDDDLRRAHMVRHASQLRKHVDSLASKAYWQQFDGTPEFVVAFVPGDPLLGAALEHDPTLLEHAFASRVVLTTPTTFIATLRAIAFSWQQENLAENAREVQSMARELYKRMAIFAEHLARLGKGLSGAVDSYNKAVGSLERNVMPHARRFHDLGAVSGADKPIPELEPLECATRTPVLPDVDVVGEDTTRTAPEPESEFVEAEVLQLLPAEGPVDVQRARGM